MAEVKKPPSFNHSSSSYKHIYDDVFSTPRQSRQQQSSSFADDDYAEMFGSSRSNNGTWSISYSSIPVLDLPPPSEMKVRGASGVTTVAGERGGNVDYGGVFGGFGDGNVGLPDGEEMFELFNKRSKTSSKSIPRSKVKTTEATRSEILTQSQNDQSRTNGLSPPVDRLQDFEQKKNEVAMKSSGEIPKETQTRDFPEVSHKLEEPILAQTTVDEKVPVIPEGTQLDKDVYPENQEEKHDRHISMDLGANVPIINSGVLKEPGFSASDSSDKAHVTSQAATESTNAFSQPSDSTKNFDHMNNKMHNTMTSEAACGTDNHVIHETTSVLHEIDPTHMSNETSVTKDDAETKMDDVDMAEEQGKHSRNSSPELNASNHNSELHATSQDTRQQGKHSRNSSPELNASNHNSELHATSQDTRQQGKHSRNSSPELNATNHNSELHATSQDTRQQGKHSRNSSPELNATNHNSELHATSQDTRQPDSGAGMSKTVGDDVVIDFNARRKKGMHSRITSLDLGRHKHLYEQDGNLPKNRRFGNSQSFDASHDPHAHVKVHPSMMAPSSSVPQFFPVESHYKISENSSWKNFGADVYRGATVFSASLDEQLDANSAAGASVAALERALEEATMIIQMAKEYLERESQGFSNVRFKDTLKVKVTEDEMDEFQPSMEHVNYPPVDTNKGKFPFLKDTPKMKIAKDNQSVDEISSFQQPMIHENFVPADIEKEILSPSERKSVLDYGQPPPISDDMSKVFDIVPEVRDQMKSAKDEGCMEDSIMHDNSSTTCLEEERTSLLETGQPALVSEDPLKFVEDDAIHDGKRFAQDEGCIEERNSNISKLTDERDSQEGGGEWEAAKHLNQLLCGVKNKIASFMAWQSDTEKKEELKETETCIRSQLQSEEGEPDLRDVEHTDVKTVEKNQDNTGSLEEHVEMEIGFLSETVEPDENQSFGHNTAEQQKASSSVESNPVVAASVVANYMFTPFRNEGVSDATDSDEEGHIVSEEVTETASMTVRENMLNEMKYEQLQGKCSEQNHDTLDNTFITQDSVEQADQYRHIDSDIEEIDEIMEEPHSVASKDKNEPTTKEDATRSLDENFRRDAINDPHSPELIARKVGENGNCEEHEVTKETENRQHDVQPVEEEVDLEGEITQCTKVFEGTCGIPEIERDEIQPSNTEESTCETHGQNEFMTDDTLTDQSGKTGMVAEKANFSDEVDSMKTESSCIEMIGEEKAEKTSFMSEAEDEYTNTAKEHTENTIEQVAQHAPCVAADANHSVQTENVNLCEAERPCRNDERGAKIEEAQHAPCVAADANHSVQTENVSLCEAEKPCRNDESGAKIEEAVSFDEIAKEASFITKAEDEHTQIKNVHNEDIIEQVAEQAACFATMEDDCQQAGNVHLSEAEGPGRNDHSSVEVEEAVSIDEEEDEGRTTENPCPLSDPGSIKEEAVLFYDSFTELDVITENLDEKKTLQGEDSVWHSSQSDVYHEEEEITANIMDTESRDVLDDQTEHLLDPEESPNVEEATNNGQEMDTCGVDAAVLRRRRWFDNGVKVGPVERPSILEGGITEMESDQEALDDSVQTGSVEIHADKLDSDRPEVIYSEVTTPVVNQDSGSVHSESTPKRKRWSVKIGEEGLPVPPPLFQGIDVNLEDPENSVKETLLHSRSEGSLDKLNTKSGEAVNATEASVDVNGGKDKSSVEATPRRKRWFGSGENVKRASLFRNEDDVGVTVGIDQSEVKEDIDSGKLEKMPTEQEPEVEPSKVEPVNDRHLDEVNRKEKEKLAVERAIREARERAFAEAKQRARRDASERSNVDARQKVAAGAQDRAGKVPAEAHTSSDKASMDAKLRAERAAVERATAEARERALQKALSEKASQRTREQAGRFPAEKNTSSDPSFQSSSSSSRVDSSNKGEKYDGFDSVSGQRRKERLERRSRTSERPATVLEEKNQRDLLVQKEQAAKNMMADSLDAEVKRWSAGKEGNLRLLLSTLQYILSPESGWQAVSFTDLVEATIVRKAYKKATLCVHPDKLQQRGATIQQKYICERVFDLLKDAWSKLNPDER